MEEVNIRFSITGGVSERFLVATVSFQMVKSKMRDKIDAMKSCHPKTPLLKCFGEKGPCN